jgi:hypothetical protein
VAKISNILPKERIKAPRGGENRRAIWIDSVLRGHVEKTQGGYVWVEGPVDQVPQQRTHAVDLLVVHLLDTRGITLDGFVPRSPKERNVSKETKAEVDRRDKGLCQYCLMEGRRTEGEEYDHFIPFALGGGSDASNVQLACEGCNHEKKWHTHPEVLYREKWEDWAPGKPRPNV